MGANEALRSSQLITIFLVFVIVIIERCVTFKVIDEDVAQIKKFEVCDKRKYLINIVGFELKGTHRGLIGIDAVFEATEDIGNVTKQLLRFTRCRSFIERESCELFTSFKSCDTCSQLKEKGQLWSSLFENIAPPFVCPIKKGRYVMKNGTLDASSLSKTPGMKGFYWEIRQQIYNSQGKLFLCYVLGLEIKKQRRRIN